MPRSSQLPLRAAALRGTHLLFFHWKSQQRSAFFFPSPVEGCLRIRVFASFQSAARHLSRFRNPSTIPATCCHNLYFVKIGKSASKAFIPVVAIEFVILLAAVRKCQETSELRESKGWNLDSSRRDLRVVYARILIPSWITWANELESD